MKITIKLNGAEHVINRLNRARLKNGLVTSTMLVGIAERAVRSVQRGIRNQESPDGTPYPPVNRFGKGGERLRDTGRLLKSITYQIDGNRIIVGTNVIYAAMQHFGGTQHPSRAKMLAIPLTRQVARAVASGTGYRTAFPDAFVFHSKAGNLFLARKAGQKKGPSALELLAILKTSVKIQGTHFLGLSAEGEADILGYMERTVGKFVEDGK